MGPFTKILTSSKLIAAFGDEETAVLIYDPKGERKPGPLGPGKRALFFDVALDDRKGRPTA
jgi:hypothetical protein